MESIVSSGIRVTDEEIRCIQLQILNTIIDICENEGLQYFIISGTLIGAVRHKGFIPWDDDIDIALLRDDYERFQKVCRKMLPDNYTLTNSRMDWKIPHTISKIYDNRTILMQYARPGHRVRTGAHVDIFPIDGVSPSQVRENMRFSWLQLLRKLLYLVKIDRSAGFSFIKDKMICVCQLIMTGAVIKRIHRHMSAIMMKYDVRSSEEVCCYAGVYGKKEYFPRSWIGEGVNLDFEGVKVRAFTGYDHWLRNIYGDYLKLPAPDERKPPHEYDIYWRA